MGKSKEKEKRKARRKEFSLKECRKVGRSDGLRLKTLKGYTFTDFVEAVTARYQDRICYRVFRQGDENDMTYNQLGWYSYAVASYLMDKGVKKGDRIAILGESCPNWMVMYLGIVMLGAIAVPILPDFSAREAKFIIKDSGSIGVCVNTKQYQKIADISPDLMVFRMEDLVHVPSSGDDYTFDKAPGFAMKSTKLRINDVKAVKPAENDIASLIYTSGTTGSSKGVELSHMNILRGADLATDVYISLKPGWKALSILPMSHVYEFTIGQVLTLLSGLDITFLGKPPAVSILLPALAEVRPHVMLSVPLLIEKVYRSAVLPVLRDNQKIGKMIKMPVIGGFVYRTIGRKLMTTFGHRLKFFGIGGAPLDGEVERFLHKAHFPYAIGYGLTETSPLVAGCGSAHSRQHPGYIGEIVADDDVILLDKNEEGVGEIAVKGPNVMRGYYNNPELNKESFTEDGYFKTGDLGYIGKHNRLAIRGRVKTMILGPGGENIYPETIESIINSQSFVEESLVVPENGGLVALIKLDMNMMAEKLKISAQEAQQEAQKYIKAIRNQVNSELSAYSKISDVQLQEEPFDRTPTQKIKRFLYPKKKAKAEEKNDDK